MKKSALSVFCSHALLFLSVSISAQRHDIQALLNQVKPPACNKITALPTGNVKHSPNLNSLFSLEEKYKSNKPFSLNSTARATGTSDTIIVGVAPNDTLIITGTYTHTGPIIVVLNGVLIIKDATMTNLGDLILMNNSKALIDSSNISFPQSYFYQRSLTLINKAYASISNTTLSYGGFSHNLVVADTAQIVFKNVTQPDWMTTGLSSMGSVAINGTNQAGEFVITDRCNVNIKNATNVILWHQFPDTAVINWSFGKSDTAYGYRFNNTQPGVKGVEYNVSADSCYDIMWSMMPSSGSIVNITNSKIRSIGLWFDKPHDSVTVSGITDNSTYSSYTTPLPDRTLTFSNCTVQTWSMYLFHKSIVNLSGCIAGEIGAYNSSKFYGSSYVVDGSGGYHYSGDTSKVIASNATVTTNVRSEHNGMFILGYSTVGGSGIASAIGNSLLIVVQSSVPVDPQALEGSDAWFDNINQPGNLFADSIAPLNGSAWIHRGPTSNWMYFKSWQLFYQLKGDTGWTVITGADTNEIGNSLLANWDTHGLASGTYSLDLRLNDSWGNSVDAIRQVTLLPLILGVNELHNISDVIVYPNPADKDINIELTLPVNEKVQVKLTSILGQDVLINNCRNCVAGKNKILLNTASLPNGIYVCHIIMATGSVQRLVEIVK